MKVAKWGNSLAVRLPASVVEALALEEGDDIEIDVANARGLAIAKGASRLALLKRLRKHRGALPAGFSFNRLEANERD